ncbi:MAG: ABC transporter ATP-binding protein [Lachnospiraceae bacterium]|nr:ABC transporter ATP-binding protein [Lachnospiraceae bacterium]
MGEISENIDVSIQDLWFSYNKEKVILKDISIEFDKPELVSILGPNGVGKSTLIHCMDRILKPTKGKVFIDGKDVQSYSLKELAVKQGYVPCMSVDTFPMSVADSVLLGRHPHSNWKSSRKDVEIVYDVLRDVGIEDLAMRPFNSLSAGQHQKVMLARGLAQQTKILLLDEPTANLDVKHQLEVTRMLRDVSRKRGILIIMICHDLNIAAKYSDRIIMLKEGTIYATGSVEDVITEENVRQVYGVDCRIIDDCGRPHVILEEMGKEEAPAE